MKLKEITVDKKHCLPLLLTADPCEVMINRYLDDGRLFVIEELGETVCVAVVIELENDAWELKNLATGARHQGKGYGTQMVKLLFEQLRGICTRMIVGTAENGKGFYERLGFVYVYTKKNFFTENYPTPIFDNGVQCVDMLYLEKNLMLPH